MGLNTSTKKIYSMALFLTSVFVFMIWNLIQRCEIEWIQNPILKQIARYLIDYIFAYGFFEMILQLFYKGVSRNRRAKRWILSASYLEGVWVGYYEEQGEIIFFYEQIEQNFVQTQIRGYGYDAALRQVCCWNSQTVNIDPNKGCMETIYEVDEIQSRVKKEGISHFQFHRQDRKRPPDILVGYSLELDAVDKIRSYETKICCLPNRYQSVELIQKAMELYQQDREELRRRQPQPADDMPAALRL